MVVAPAELSTISVRLFVEVGASPVNSNTIGACDVEKVGAGLKTKRSSSLCCTDWSVPETKVPRTFVKPLGCTKVVPMSRRLELTQLTERTCKWPIGDPLNDDFHFCGNESPDNSPYCTYHQRLAYQPSAERPRMR